MKYLNVSTRRRPEWNEFWKQQCDKAGVTICPCGMTFMNKQITFTHWNDGHFDEYDEVKE